MGALDNTNDGRTFLNTFKGKFTKRVNPETEGAKSRINKNGKQVFELLFDTLRDVIIQEFEKRNSDEYGFSWNVKIADSKSDDTFTLTLPYSGRVTMGLFFRLPNVKINEPITLKLYYFEEEDKTALVVYQGNNKVEAYWTKDTPHDMPDLVKSTLNGKDVWDSTARMAYFENWLETQLKPQMNVIENSPSSSVDDIDQTPENVTVNQDKTKPLVEWDGENQTFKIKDGEGDKYFECEQNGTLKRDQDGKKVPALPF